MTKCCRESVVGLNRLYIGATPDISHILSLRIFEVFVAPREADTGSSVVLQAGEAMLLCSPAPFRMIEVASAHVHKLGHLRLREDLSKRACVCCRSASSWLATVLSEIDDGRSGFGRNWSGLENLQTATTGPLDHVLICWLLHLTILFSYIQGRINHIS